jgi:hypothetical protein
MKRLVDAFVRRGTTSLVMMLHSSSLAPGFSPYVPDAAALECFHEQLAETFAYCKSRYDVAGPTLSEFANNFT